MGGIYELLTEWIVPAAIVLIVEAALYKLYCRWKAGGGEVSDDCSPRLHGICNETAKPLRAEGSDGSDSKSVRVDGKMAPVCVDFNSLSRVSSIETAADISSRTTSNSCSIDGVGQESRVYTPRTVLNTLCAMEKAQQLAPPNYGTISAIRRSVPLPPQVFKSKAAFDVAEKTASSAEEPVVEAEAAEVRENATETPKCSFREDPRVIGETSSLQDRPHKEAQASLEEKHRKANAEAFFLLQRALKFRQIDVAKTVLRDFQREGVPINPGVFALLVQVALSAKDYAVSSDWLIQLLAIHGHVDPAWLDRVFAATSVGSPAVFAGLLESLSKQPQMSEACKAVLERAQVYLDTGMRKSGSVSGVCSSSASIASMEPACTDTSLSGGCLESSSASKNCESGFCGSALTSKEDSGGRVASSRLSAACSSRGSEDLADGVSVAGTDPSFDGASPSPCSSGNGSTNLNPNAPEFVPCGVSAMSASVSASSALLQKLMQTQALLNRGTPSGLSNNEEDSAKASDPNVLMRLASALQMTPLAVPSPPTRDLPSAEGDDGQQRLRLLETLLILLHKAGAGESIHSTPSVEAPVPPESGAAAPLDPAPSSSFPFPAPTSLNAEALPFSPSSARLAEGKEAEKKSALALGCEVQETPSTSKKSRSAVDNQSSTVTSQDRSALPQTRKSRHLIVQALLSNMKNANEHSSVKTPAGGGVSPLHSREPLQGSRLTPISGTRHAKIHHQQPAQKEDSKETVFKRRPPLPPRPSNGRATRIVDTPQMQQ